ncbi:copper transport protein ctr1 [Actinomortierella ambigua]|uniref:Copper transport protein ctr1 n=1 Tax=Actinomortierella ambigua TaxID=1343610 RepID=A0A9P6PMF4_9FUNG|nr:copper transport protein ctr1 [Actinomortierella ambigua]
MVEDGKHDSTDSTSSTNSPLAIDELVGTPTSSAVYRTRLLLMHDAAKASSPDQLERRQNAIRREIAILQQLRHPHLIQFHKTREENGNLYIIMETTAKDSLTAFVESSGLDWSTRIRVGQEVARGLEYLHHSSVIHQDLRSDNVLLTKSMMVKLCGFGTAQRRPASTRILAGSADATVRWMAPELFIGTPMHSTKSDIFAFGMVLWQMAAKCSLPFRSHDSYQAAMRIQNGAREEIPEGTPTAYRTWIEWCWDQEPWKRPEASTMIPRQR